MYTVLASLVAAVAAIPLNWTVVGRLGRPAIIFLVPLIEEGLKTGLSLAAGVPLLGVHLFFGFIEAVYDSILDKARSFCLSLSSVFGHLLFGGITHLTWRYSGSLYLGIGMAVLAHMLWNSLLTDLRGVKRGGKG